MWKSTGPHHCPNCPATFNKKGDRRIDPPLDLVRENYSGCGVDFAQCPTCRRVYQVSYKVDKILDVTDEMAKLGVS